MFKKFGGQNSKFENVHKQFKVSYLSLKSYEYCLNALELVDVIYFPSKVYYYYRNSILVNIDLQYLHAVQISVELYIYNVCLYRHGTSDEFIVKASKENSVCDTYPLEIIINIIEVCIHTVLCEMLTLSFIFPFSIKCAWMMAIDGNICGYL